METKVIDESTLMTKAADRARPGRFFNDKAALQAEIDKFWDLAVGAPVELPKAEKTRIVRGAFFAMMLNAMRGYVAGNLNFVAERVLSLHDAHDDRISALEQRLAEVEGEPLAYKGTHEPGRLYERNSVVTHAGSMWVALRRTQQRPGDGGDAWQLAVKAGRDAR